MRLLPAWRWAEVVLVLNRHTKHTKHTTHLYLFQEACCSCVHHALVDGVPLLRQLAHDIAGGLDGMHHPLHDSVRGAAVSCSCCSCLQATTPIASSSPALSPAGVHSATTAVPLAAAVAPFQGLLRLPLEADVVPEGPFTGVKRYGRLWCSVEAIFDFDLSDLEYLSCE